jgi:hypothetical protein
MVVPDKQDGYRHQGRSQGQSEAHDSSEFVDIAQAAMPFLEFESVVEW